MSDPTVEEVREALTDWDALDKDEGVEPVATLVAAARLWVDAAEPDIEAAAQTMTGGEYYTEDFHRETAKIAIAAAFGDNTLIRRADR